jgi:hypothetical protein
MSFLLRNARMKRTQYRRTVEAIQFMSPVVALDLDIFPEDAKKIAFKAVYGE